MALSKRLRSHAAERKAHDVSRRDPKRNEKTG